LTRIAVADIDEHVLRLFSMVSEGLTAATAAFLDGDRDMARALIAGDQSIDSLQDVTEELLYAELDRALRDNDGGIRALVAALQIVPELERSGDLVEHIALRTQQGLAMEISPLARALVGQMGRIGAEMWRAAALAYAGRDATAADALRQRDDELDDLHVQLSVELAASGTSVPVAIEMGLVARFYERLGDHAVNVARRVARLASSLEGVEQ
jgi:phosphate transport system protein